MGKNYAARIPFGLRFLAGDAHGVPLRVVAMVMAAGAP